MNSRRSVRVIASALSTTLALLTTVRLARAMTHELQLGAGPSAFVSTWRGDYGGGVTARLGWRLGGVFGVDFQGWEGIASVDTRLDTGLSLGLRGSLPLRGASPFARLFVVHQHEEGLVSAQSDPLGVVAGIGAGIRHRAGAGGSLGVEVPLRREGTRTKFTLFSQGNAMHLGNRLGPDWYFGLDIGVGLDLLL